MVNPSNTRKLIAGRLALDFANLVPEAHDLSWQEFVGFLVGARVVSVDESSIRDIPGARLLRRGDFLGVVAESEWDAVRAARQLKVTWEATSALPGNEKLYDRMRSAGGDKYDTSR